MAFDDLGEQLVKNIPHPIRAFRLRIGEDTSEQAVATPAEAAEPPDEAAAIPEPSADSEVALELAYWNSVKDGSPTELATYLERYPDGTFASLARTRVDAGALSPPGPAAATPAEVPADPLDLAFWDSVKDSKRREELQAYLEQHPNGHFAGLPRARLSSTSDA
jgi:adenylate cyclase